MKYKPKTIQLFLITWLILAIGGYSQTNIPKDEKYPEKKCKEQPNIYGVKCTHYKYDEKNRKIEQRYLDLNGDLVNPEGGPSIIEYSYDDNDRIIEKRYYFKENQPMKTFWKIKSFYSKKGMLKKEILYNSDGSIFREDKK